MTEERAKEIVLDYISTFEGCCESATDDAVANNIRESYEAFEFILDKLDENTSYVRKYQRIKQIVLGDWDKGYQLSETLTRVREVLNSEE